MNSNSLVVLDNNRRGDDNNNDEEATVDEEGRPIQPKDERGWRAFLAQHGWIALGVVLVVCAILLVLKVVLPLLFGSSSSSDHNTNTRDSKLATVTDEGSYSFGLHEQTGDAKNNSVILVDSSETGFPEPETQCVTNAAGFVVTSGTVEEAPLFPEINSVHPSWAEGAIGVGTTWDSHIRTFDVVPNHTVLDNGVVFHVETLPEALPEHVRQTHLTEEEILDQVKTEAGLYYREEGYPEQPLPNVELEVLSFIGEGNLVFAGGQGFVAACMMAFAYHLPLALSPDDLWTVILQGFAHHVDQHGEELRSNFVNHTTTGTKKEIRVQEDRLRKGVSTPEQWQEWVFPKFSKGMEQNMNNSQVYDLLANTTFSTSTPASHAASEIVLMAAMKSYFEYTLVTSCGIPRIQLDGTRDDWQSLRDRAEKLGPWMMQNHTQGNLWIENVVLPILDEFLQSYDGNMNYCFWQNMVKFRNTQSQSGAFDFLSGWLPNLFPYLNQGNAISPNRNLRHWSLSALGDLKGPDPDEIPIQMSSAPVLWKYLEEELPLHFNAGFRGVSQDAENGGILRPVLGWYVSYDP